MRYVRGGSARPGQDRRVALTVAVRDTDAIPKVADAGKVASRDGVRVQVMHNGVVVREGCYYGGNTTEIIGELRGHHEPQEEVVFHAILERLRAEGTAPVMLELGSYWAYYSMWAKTAIPSARLVLVEPDLGHLRVGLDNMALNAMAPDVVEHAAVGAAHGVRRVMPWESDGRLHRTRFVTVDGLMADHGLDRLDVVLCDVQGAELDALRGAAQALRERRVRFLVVSTHHHMFSADPLTHQRCLHLLLEHGAHIVAEHSVFESCSGDGLIVASLDPRDTSFTVPITIVRSRDSVCGEVEFDVPPKGPVRRRLSQTTSLVRHAPATIAAARGARRG